MSDELIPIEDLPNPELPELQQREIPYPAVDVNVKGSVLTHALPNRVGVLSVDSLSDTVPTKLLSADFKRARATILAASVTFITATHILVARTKTGTYAPWPVNVALVVLHCDELWAKLNAAGSGQVTTISEIYAD